MSKNSPGAWHTVVGLAFAAAGVSKLLAVEPQRTLFRSWGWSEEDMQLIGAAELGGAAMLMTRPLSRLGAALLSATSVCICLAEIRHDDDRLVTPRLGLLGAAASCAFIGRG